MLIALVDPCKFYFLSFLISQDGKSGRTALHYAAESGQIELLRYLLDNPKIDVNAQTYSRLTPIKLAKGREMTEAVRLLREKGAVVESEESEEEDMVIT